MLVMLEYIPFTVHMNLWKDRLMEDRYSWSWAAFVWFHSNFSVVIHNVSVWLTLSLAVWRFIMIRSVLTLNDKNRTLGNDFPPCKLGSTPRRLCTAQWPDATKSSWGPSVSTYRVVYR